MQPIMLTLLVTCTVYVFLISPKNATLAGSKEYLAKVRADMGRMSRDEALCFTVFLVAVGLAFTRSLYAELLPGPGAGVFLRRLRDSPVPHPGQGEQADSELEKGRVRG